MQLRYFVTICSAVLLGWLGLTFVHEVPSTRYKPQAAQAQAMSPAEQLQAVEEGLAAELESIVEKDDLAVSVSP